MDILQNFGFDLKLFLAQIVNFLILAYVFKRFLYKPVTDMLADRKKKIQQGIEDSEKARILLEETEKKKNTILRDTRTEAQEIIDSAKKIADEARAEILGKARKESDSIIQDAKTQADLQMKKMQQQLQAMSLDVSYGILSKTIQNLFTDKERAEILKRSEESLKNN